jgi:sugar transferase (PEP-CTERM system associated)
LPDSHFSGRRTVLIVVEFVLLFLGLLAVSLALGQEESSNWPRFILKMLVAIVAVQMSLYYGGLYDDSALRSRTSFVLQLGQVLVAGTLVLVLIYYLVPSLKLGREVLLTYLPLSVLTIIVWHSLHLWVSGREALSETVLILGTGESAQQIAVEMLRRPPLGYRVAGFLGEHPREVGEQLINPSVLGIFADLARLVTELRVSLIIVALDDRRGKMPVEQLLDCRMAGVRVEDAPNFFERLTGKIMVSNLRPSWLVFSEGFVAPQLLNASKRAVESLAALVVLALTTPLLGLLAILIKLDSPGQVIYRQERVGERGKVFNLLKLRTMRTDAEQRTGPVWASPDRDPRITRLGRLLRKLRLDELPQLFNVLRGEMSFVGPRPERPHFVEQLRKVIPYYDQRHSVRPGITGWAQVKFGYGSTIEDSETKLQFDLYYIKNMSILLDLAIIVDTAKVVLLGRGAR